MNTWLKRYDLFFNSSFSAYHYFGVLASFRPLISYHFSEKILQNDKN
jgi:hypothetical protein